MGEQKTWVEGKGWQLVIVHMGPGDGLPGIDDGALAGVPQIADPDCELYRSFGLEKGTLWQMFEPAVWARGVKAVLAGNRGGLLRGDGMQLPGMFLVEDGKVAASHIGQHAADHGRPRMLAASGA